MHLPHMSSKGLLGYSPGSVELFEADVAARGTGVTDIYSGGKYDSDVLCCGDLNF